VYKGKGLDRKIVLTPPIIQIVSAPVLSTILFNPTIFKYHPPLPPTFLNRNSPLLCLDISSGDMISLIVDLHNKSGDEGIPDMSQNGSFFLSIKIEKVPLMRRQLSVRDPFLSVSSPSVLL
jgi:hypothetical protein